MKLHHNPMSPFVRMVCVTAHELNMVDKIENVFTGEFLPDRENAQVIAANPLGRIPCLVTDDGSSIFDSRVICEYLCEIADGGDALLPASGEARFRVLTLQAMATGLMDSGVAMRYELGLRPEEKQWPEWIARQKGRINTALDDLEANWQKELEGVHAGSIAIGCLLGYFDFRYPDMGWRDGRPALDAFYEAFGQRPSMQATVPVVPG